MKLYSYFRSSASFRVRIALVIKGLEYETIPVHLVKAEHKTDDYTTKNPAQLVPTFADDDFFISQSLAILEYLDETYPNPPLLPSDSKDKAFVRMICQMIACDIHPINNLRVLNYLKNDLHITDEQKNIWYQHWITIGFDALEKVLTQHKSDDKLLKFCFGETPTMADCCLIPQVYNAKRFNCELTNYPNIVNIYEHCMTLITFIQAYPDNQIDAN